MINSLTLGTVHSPRFAQLGAFGYCTNGICSKSKLGYDLTRLVGSLSNNQSNQSSGLGDGIVDGVSKTLTAVTKGFILHPIAAAFAFLAMIVACLSDKIGYLFASILAVLAFLSSLAAMIIDFVAISLVKNHIGDAGGRATFGTGTWLTLAATILLFIATFTTLLSCCCGRSRKHKRREKELRDAEVMRQADYNNGVAPKRKFWQRGAKTGAVGTGAGVGAAGVGHHGTHHNDGLVNGNTATGNYADPNYVDPGYGNTTTGGVYNNNTNTYADGYNGVAPKRKFWQRGEKHDPAYNNTVV